MKKIKLGFTDTHEHLSLFFQSVLSKRYDIEIDNNNPDYLIFGDEVFGRDNLRFSKNDCVKIFYTGENRRPENYDCHYAISFDHNFNSWHYRLPLFVIYMWALGEIHKTNYQYYHLFGNNVAKEKTGFASYVVSNPGCVERNTFFDKLNAIKPIDSGGRHKNNIGYLLEGEQGKIDFLADRKFNICFEPYSHPGYTTEKILHAFYAKTIPIYWGSPTVSVDFNPKAFINTMNFPSQEHAIEYVMKVDSDDNLYQEIINEKPMIHNIPKDYIMLDNFLNWFDAVVYNKIEARQ